ncbi:MAG TPA: decarboxylating 6-phosphogluconate dehydrogenase, partial [Armatimonadota bacterium]
MRLAMVGLGRMGANMVTRLLRGGHVVVAYNRSEGPRKTAVGEGAEEATTLDEVADLLTPPRIAWVMMPAGEVTASFITELAERFAPGDIIIDGGNNFYKDTMRHAAMLAERGIRFVDAGTSGGIWGVTEGYSLMLGGETEVIEYLRPIFETLAPTPSSGWGHVGPHGAGHFTKMVHNGIEYGMMQAYAEGFALLQQKQEFHLDLHQVAEVWREGSVVRSWLLDLAASAFKENPSLAGIAPYVADSGEGRWTVLEGIELGVPLPIITLSLQNR